MDYESPDTHGYHYHVVIDGENALPDLHQYVPFCNTMQENVFTDYAAAISAAQGLRSVLAESAIIGIVVAYDD